ncbi:MAG: nicotinate-nucleotide adenylyltransferase [Oscillospiraceae bacterium]|nr:nicotinate-nucleotide adenylyltransferase [Oscillospiraceae bacterium]
MKRQLGLFGGSFNPIHKGHLHLVRAVKKELKLDGVILMPAGEAPHKSTAEYAPAADRLRMCRLAAKNYRWLTVSDYETAKSGKSYTVDTLRALRAAYPDAEWTLMIGSDMLLTFETWREWQEILHMARLCAVSRESGDLPRLREKAESLKALCPGAEILVLSVQAVPVSSTEIRQNLKKNADCSCLLPENVVQYIRKKHLYGNDPEQTMG